AVALAARVDVEGGSVVVVEGAEALVGRPGLAQRDVTADDVHDVVGFFDLFDPVVCQGPPASRSQPGVRAERGRAVGPTPIPLGREPSRMHRQASPGGPFDRSPSGPFSPAAGRVGVVRRVSGRLREQSGTPSPPRPAPPTSRRTGGESVRAGREGGPLYLRTHVEL